MLEIVGSKRYLMGPEEKLILALDVDSLEKGREIVRELMGCVNMYKVGSRLFCAEGPDSVKMVKSEGGRVFLDLKLHDIPNTVAGTSEAIAGLGVDMFDVHTLGGIEMMKAAREAAARAAVDCGHKRPLVLGVTVLTHIEDGVLREELGIDISVEEEVKHLTAMAMDAGLDGLICSPREISTVRKICGDRVKIITPGIRPSWAQPGDQRRTLSPAEAMREGADYLVVGRPVLEAADRREAVRKIIDEIADEDAK